MDIEKLRKTKNELINKQDILIHNMESLKSELNIMNNEALKNQGKIDLITSQIEELEKELEKEDETECN